MSSVTGLPYIVVLERVDAPGANLTPWPSGSKPTEDSPNPSNKRQRTGDEPTPEKVLPKALGETFLSTSKQKIAAKGTLDNYFKPKQASPKTSAGVASSTESPQEHPQKRCATAAKGRDENKKQKSGCDRDQSGRDQDRSGRDEDRDRSGRDQDRDRSGQYLDQSGRDQSERDNARRRCECKARQDSASEKSDPLDDLCTPVMLFKKRYGLKRSGADDRLRHFPDEPVSMPPISCLLKGCEGCWINSREEFEAHCIEHHGGVQAYRNRVLFLLSKTVFDYPGSLQRAAMQSFAEFQCRAQTDWQNYTDEMKQKQEQEGIPRTERWDARSWVACVVCRLQHWREEMVSAYVAGKRCCFSDPQAVAKLLSPQQYNKTWPLVASLSELEASSVELCLPTGSGDNKFWAPIGNPCKKKVLLHKRRLNEAMCEGDEKALLCKDCHECLTKQKPAMPVLR